jgi:hypothetical protein
MGRTIPSFRMATIEELKEWKEFRNGLDKSDRKLFDKMYATCHLYNSACMCAANPIRIQPIFMSIIFNHYRILKELESKLNNKELANNTDKYESKRLR